MASGSRIRSLGLYCHVKVLDHVLNTGRIGVSAYARRGFAAVPVSVQTSILMPAIGMGPYIGNRAHAGTPISRILQDLQEVETLVEQDNADYSLYSRRHRFPGYMPMLKLFNSGQILEAMTRFYLACTHWEKVKEGKLPKGESNFEITPHIVDDIVRCLSRLANTTDEFWPGHKQTTESSSYWIPPNLGNDVDVKTMAVPSLCLHAICSIYDLAGALDIIPSDSSLAAITNALSRHVDEDTYTKCVVMLLLRKSGISYQESVLLALSSADIPLEQVDFSSLSPKVMRGILDGYGRLGSPHIGEAMIRSWSKEEGKINAIASFERESLELAWQMATDGKQNSLHPPVWCNSSSWWHNVMIWSALIRSRASSNDLAGARYWFQKYRQEGLRKVRAINKDMCGLPHVTYLLACTRVRKEEVDKKVGEDSIRADEWIENGKSRYVAIRDVLTLMYSDGVSMSLELYSLLLNIQLGYGRIFEAIEMVSMFLQSKEAKNSWSVNLYKSFFHLHRLMHIREKDISKSDLKKMVAMRKRGGKFLQPGDLRLLYKDFVNNSQFTSGRWNPKSRVDGLEVALQASLATEDYPLAHQILTWFKDNRIALSEKIQNHVVRSIFPSQYKEARQMQRKNHYRLEMHQKLRNLLESNTSESEIHRIIVTSTYEPKSPQRYLENSIRFIKFVATKMVNRFRKVLRRNRPPVASDAKWIHEAYLAFKRNRLGKVEKLSEDDLKDDEELLCAILQPFEPDGTESHETEDPLDQQKKGEGGSEGV